MSSQDLCKEIISSLLGSKIYVSGIDLDGQPRMKVERITQAKKDNAEYTAIRIFSKNIIKFVVQIYTILNDGGNVCLI